MGMVHLPQPGIEDWIAALRSDITATVTAPPIQEQWDELMEIPKTKPATWRLGMFASAYFYVVSKDDVQRLSKAIPQLHKEFQALTHDALTRYLAFDSGAIKRKPYSQDAIEAEYAKDQRLATITGFDALTKESSSKFSFDTLAQFDHAAQTLPVFRPGIDVPITDREIEYTECTFGLGYFSVNFPLSFWRSHGPELRRWWLKALHCLQPVQAYMGLGVGLPPILERYPFQQPAEFALANQFLGLDVDKPFFVRSNRPDGMHLECGMRTPSFGVLVLGDYLARLGGETALRAKLQAVHDAAGRPALRLEPCLDGLWIEAGSAPALYPVEDGVPPHLQALAEALKPVRLERLWLVSYPPNLPRDDIFTPQASARWLRRFDRDSDWGGLVDGKPPSGASSAASPAAAAQPHRVPGGSPCPQAGWWRTPAMQGSRRYFEAGQTMSVIEGSAWGATFWIWDSSQHD